MACILHIESSTDICSVALSENGQCIYEDENRESRQHARLLAPLAAAALSFADSHAIPLDAVAVSKGPGSYTGLRIGVSLAKGICYGREIPLIGISTLELLCVPLLLEEELPEDALLCPMIDARRMEVYAALYNRSLRVVREAGADIVTTDSYREYLDNHPVWFLGNGSEKCQPLLAEHPHAHFRAEAVPLARNMMPLAEKAFLRGNFEDTAYFEPFYLKDFVTNVKSL